MIPEFAKAVDAIRKDLLETADRYASGPYLLAALAAMDHPYARRHGRAMLDPRVVNIQRGTFRSSFRVRLVAGDPPVLVMDNVAPHARFLFSGTRLMVERPIMDAIQAEVAPRAAAECARALAAALQRVSR